MGVAGRAEMMRIASRSRTMYDEEQIPVLGESNGGLPRFAVATGIRQAHKGVEEDFTGQFETHAVLAQARCGFRGVPFKRLAVENVRTSITASVYTL